MALLDLITKASASHEPLSLPSSHPIVLNPDEIFANLKPQTEDSHETSLIKPLSGWKISETDLKLIDSSGEFIKKLKRKLKDTRNFDRKGLGALLSSFLEKNGRRVGVSVGVDQSDKADCVRSLVEKLGFLMGHDVAVLVTEACLVLEDWELLETLIVNDLVQHTSYSSLVLNLVENNRSDLLCSCVKHFKDLQSVDLVNVLKYFLSLPQEGSSSNIESVRSEWESQALMGIKKATDKTLKEKTAKLAKEAAILLMMAHDGFSDTELCLHYLFSSSSSNVDEVILSSAIAKLNGSEMMGLIRYLRKWLNKYESFPQAVPCPGGSLAFGLKACEWVPSLNAIVNCLGLVVDEHFSSLVLHQEFHGELRSVEKTVGSLASEARICCSMANVVEKIILEAKSFVVGS